MNANLRYTVLMMMLFTSFADANDASYYGRGATVFAYKEHRVRMVSEHIKIRQLSGEKLGQKDWFADCTFVFENLQDSPLTIQMGFPDSKAHPHDHYTIVGFKAWVDGAAVPATHKTVHPKKPRRRWAPRVKGQRRRTLLPPPKPVKVDPELATWRAMAKESMKVMDLGFSAAYTWTVDFKAKGRVVVKNTYRFGGGSSNGPINQCIDNVKPDRDKPDWYAYEIWGEWGFGFGSGPCVALPYVVTTGGHHIGQSDAWTAAKAKAPFTPNFVGIPIWLISVGLDVINTLVNRSIARPPSKPIGVFNHHSTLGFKVHSPGIGSRKP